MLDSIRDRLERCPTLPTIPAVALEVVVLAERDELDLEALVRCIEKDPGLASRILRAANSAAASPRQPVTTLRRAVVSLGAKATRTLALTFGLAQAPRRGAPSFDYQGYWRRALYGGVAGRAMASLLPGVDPDQGFLSGLLQDIGMLALAQIGGDAYARMIEETRGDHERLARFERDAFGADHAEVGEWLLGKWRLPASLVASISASHAAKPALEPLARVAQLAGHTADVWMGTETGPAVARLTSHAAGLVARGQDLQHALEATAVGAEELAPLLDLDFDAHETAEILSRARESLVQQSIRDAHDKETDPVTGLLRRGPFEAELSRAFDEALKSTRQIAVLFVGLDGLGRINGTHGATTGDAVLEQVAQLVAAEVGTVGVPGRFAGDELVVVVPGCTPSEATDLADRIRAAVERVRPGSMGATKGVTVSVGVATLRPGFHFGPLDLLTSADRALRLAKERGGNVVAEAPGRMLV